MSTKNIRYQPILHKTYSTFSMNAQFFLTKDGPAYTRSNESIVYHFYIEAYIEILPCETKS